MFSACFKTIGLDLLSLDTEEKMKFTHKSPHSSMVFSFSRNMPDFTVDAAMVEGIGNFAVSLRSDYRRLIVTPKMGWITPKVSYTTRSDKENDLEIQLPLRTRSTSIKLCGGRKDGRLEGLLVAKRAMVFRDSVTSEFGISWPYRIYPTVSVLTHGGPLTLFGLYGEGKLTGKGRVDFGPVTAFSEAGMCHGMMRKQKFGVVLGLDPLDVGICVDALNKSVEVKNEFSGKLRGLGAALATSAKFQRNRMEAGGGIEIKKNVTRARLHLHSGGIVVTEVRLPFGKKGTIRGTVKATGFKSLPTVGCVVKFDHQ